MFPDGDLISANLGFLSVKENRACSRGHASSSTCDAHLELWPHCQSHP